MINSSMCIGSKVMTLEKKYAIENTAFQIAKYFCWVELVNKKIIFINLGKDGETRKIQGLLDKIIVRCGSDRYDYKNPYEPVTLRVFAGDQRGIGEALIANDDCIGYNQFLGHPRPRSALASCRGRRVAGGHSRRVRERSLQRSQRHRALLLVGSRISGASPRVATSSPGTFFSCVWLRSLTGDPETRRTA